MTQKKLRIRGVNSGSGIPITTTTTTTTQSPDDEFSGYLTDDNYLVEGSGVYVLGGGSTTTTTTTTEEPTTTTTTTEAPTTTTTTTEYVPSIPVVYLEGANHTGGDTWVDEQGNYNGTLMNNPTYTDNVFLFDHIDDYVNMSSIPDSFWNGGSWTVSAWVKFNGVDRPLYNDNGVVGHGQSGSGMGLQLGERQGHPVMAFWNDDLVGNSVLSNGVWYNITYCFNKENGLKQIYVNGGLDVQGYGSYNGYGNNTMFGNQPFGGDRLLNGYLNSIKLFDKVLSPYEIGVLCMNGMVVPTTTTTTTEAPTTTTTTSPVDKIYSLSGYDPSTSGNYINQWIGQYAAANSLTYQNPWVSTTNFVVNGDMVVGKEIYFLDTNGVKQLLNISLNIPTHIPLVGDEMGNPDYSFIITDGVITNIGSMFTLTYVNDYVEPTTTTTTTNPYDLYSYDPIYGVKFTEKLTGTTDWDGTTTIIVEGPLSVGSKAYYLGTDGDKHLITTPNVAIGTGGTDTNIIIINGLIPGGGFANDGSITAVDGTVPYVYTTPFQPQTVKVFKKANYGTDVDVISSYLKLKRGNTQGLFNSNEGSTYANTFMGGVNHLWASEPIGTFFNVELGSSRNYHLENIWSTFDINNINISELHSYYSGYSSSSMVISGEFNSKPMVPWYQVHNGTPLDMLNKEAIMLDVLDGKFYKVKFTQWTGGNNGGGLSYIRELIS